MNVGDSTSVIRGSSLVFFLPGIDAEQRDQVLDCLLFAELKAARQADRSKAWQQWINVYERALPVTGFQRTDLLRGAPVTVSNQRGFRSAAARLVRCINSPDLVSAAETALDGMFNSPHAQNFFSSWFTFSMGRSDSFQIVPCKKNQSGFVEIALCGLHMITRTSPRLGPWPIKYEMQLVLQGGSYRLDEDVYERSREHIAQALREGSAEYIEQINL